MTFGDHLGTHKYIKMPFPEIKDNIFQMPSGSYCIPVQPCDPGIGEDLLKVGCNSFSAIAKGFDRLPHALRADRQGSRFHPAVVAAKHPVFFAIRPFVSTMPRKRDLTVGAPEHMPAIRTKNIGCKTPPVKKQQDLLSSFQGIPCRIFKFFGEPFRSC